jgi:hypothetical protein
VSEATDKPAFSQLFGARLRHERVQKMVVRLAYREWGLTAPLPLGDGPDALLSPDETVHAAGNLIRALEANGLLHLDRSGKCTAKDERDSETPAPPMASEETT